MGIGQNISPLAVDDDAGAQAGSFVIGFESAIKKIPEKIVDERVVSIMRERIGSLPNLLFRADIDHSRADFPDSLYHRGFSGKIIRSSRG